MALESVMFGPGTTTSTAQSDELFYLAQAISGMANLEIIDSYSSASTPTRYKGDPIADAIWTSVSSVGAANSWIIVQPTNPTNIPAWQMKFQSCNTGSAFDDPSGIDYGFEGNTNYAIYERFSPLGGWSLADVNPDFNNGVVPATQAGTNRQTKFPLGTGRARHYITCDENTAIIFHREMSANRIFYFHSYFGDYTPKSVTQTGPYARCQISMNAYNASNWNFDLNNPNFMFEGDPSGAATNAPYIGFIDHTGAYITVQYTTIPFVNLLKVENQPNQFDAVTKVDLAPIIMRGMDGQYNGIIGELRLLRKAYSFGHDVRFGTDSWLALLLEYSAVIAWDGAVATV